jgi:hypothetical protein
MTSNEFVLWLKGFTEGVHEFNVTPKQWDTLKTKLAEVEDKVLVLESPSFPIYPKQPNTAPIQTLPFIQPYDPYNPYKITSGTDTTLTVSTGSSGTIVATPGYGSITYNPSTTTQMYPSGSAWSYTNNTYRPSADMWNEHQARMAHYKPYNPPYTTGGDDEIVKYHNED